MILLGPPISYNHKANSQSWYLPLYPTSVNHQQWTCITFPMLNNSNLVFFMWFLVSSKALYYFNITVTIVATNTSRSEDFSMVRLSNLVIIPLDRVFLVYVPGNFRFWGLCWYARAYPCGGTQYISLFSLSGMPQECNFHFVGIARFIFKSTLYTHAFFWEFQNLDTH